MLKKLDKKFLYICSGLILAPILLIIVLVLIRGCSSSISADKYEDKMVSAAKKYFKKNKLPKSEGGEVEVSLDDLVAGNYIKDSDDYVDDKNCDGYVKVKNNGGFYLYTPYLSCDKFKTTYIIDKLMKDVVTSKSGLYQIEDGYVYKGKKVNNYVKFADKIYRIISIDKDGILKLVKVDQEKYKTIWDQKYNSEKNMVYGKNDYSDSNIIEVLQGKYDKYSDSDKKHIIAYNACYGNRELNHKDVDTTQECSKILEKQYVSILNTYDYAMASYDSECTSIISGSCRNYNYLFDTLDSTWLMNGNADNTYEVYYYSQGNISLLKANSNKKYNLVIYVSGNELYNKGNGTIDNPYVIK